MSDQKFTYVCPTLDDETILNLVSKHFPHTIAEMLVRQKSPPLIPQATYDVPRFALRNFVNAAVEASGYPQKVADQQRQMDHDTGVIAALTEQLTSLRAENAANKADAERYRWLRESESRPRTLPHVMQAPYVIRTGEERRPFIYDANGLNPELLDAAIDAALASHPEQP